MFTTIDQFVKLWHHESEATLKLFNALTDESLKQAVANDHRTLGRIAWHIVLTIPEMMNRTGLIVHGPAEDAAVPAEAAKILAEYGHVSRSLINQIEESWTDESLTVKDDMYGQTWERNQTLLALILHQIHHRGQMTVLMRQADLKIPGMYGPSKEEWTAYGMPQPEI